PLKLQFSALRITGTIKPLGPETAILISQKSYVIISLSSIIEFTAGYIFKALTTAKVKKLINPSPTPCFVLKVSLYSFLNSKIGVMFTSLKVVNMAVVFLASTNRSATLRRSIDILLLLLPLLPPVGVPMEGTALTASSLVTRPSLPVPETEEASMPFSARIFLAAGLAEPVA